MKRKKLDETMRHLDEQLHKTPANVTETLKERGSTHGSYTDQAIIYRLLLDAMHGKVRHAKDNDYSQGARAERWGALSPDKQESLEMIMLKISRALTGDSDFPEHWLDMAGYATLILNILTSKVK